MHNSFKNWYWNKLLILLCVGFCFSELMGYAISKQNDYIYQIIFQIF